MDICGPTWTPTSASEALRRSRGAGGGDLGLHGLPTRAAGVEGPSAHRPGGGEAKRTDLPEPPGGRQGGSRGGEDRGNMESGHHLDVIPLAFCIGSR